LAQAIFHDELEHKTQYKKGVRRSTVRH